MTVGTELFIRVTCVSIENVYQSVCVLLTPFAFKDGMWDLIILIPDHCIFSIYFQNFNQGVHF